MPGEPRARETTVFTIRLWREMLSSGEAEWRGSVKNLLSGEVRYFREWMALARLLPRMLEDTLWGAYLDDDSLPRAPNAEEGGDAADAGASE